MPLFPPRCRSPDATSLPEQAPPGAGAEPAGLHPSQAAAGTQEAGIHPKKVPFSAKVLEQGDLPIQS